MFKVGDRVKVLGKGVRGGWVDGMDELIGTIGTVTEIEIEFDTYQVNNGYWFAADEIVVVNESDIKDALLVLLHDIAVGFEKFTASLEDEGDFWSPYSEMKEYIKNIF